MSGYRRRHQGAHCEVLFSAEAVRSLEKEQFDAKDRRRADRILQHLADQGPADLTKEQFKLEGRYASGRADASKMAVYAVKSYQMRMYGGFAREQSSQFLVVEIAKKKDNKADRKQLERVSRKLGEMND